MSDANRKQPDAFERFKALASNLVRVPKKEVDRKESAHRKRRAKKRTK
jgi:hypothetical protein